MEITNFSEYLTKDEQRELAREANRMAMELIYEDPDPLPRAVKLCFDYLRTQAVIERLSPAGEFHAPPEEEIRPEEMPELADLTNIPAEPAADVPAEPEVTEPFTYATDPEAVNRMINAIFATLQMDFAGNVALRSTNNAERAQIVIIDGMVCPNPLYFTCMRQGTQRSELERLAPVFDLEGFDPVSSRYVLEAVTPAAVSSQNPHDLRLSQRGQLRFTAL